MSTKVALFIDIISLLSGFSNWNVVCTMRSGTCTNAVHLQNFSFSSRELDQNSCYGVRQTERAHSQSFQPLRTMSIARPNHRPQIDARPRRVTAVCYPIPIPNRMWAFSQNLVSNVEVRHAMSKSSICEPTSNATDRILPSPLRISE